MSSAVPNTGVKDARAMPVTAASVPITVHPLVLLNVSDDAVRLRSINNASGGSNSKRRVPFGILMGTSGHATSAHTSVDFEVTLDEKAGTHELNWDMAAKRVDLCRTVLPSYDVVGWYTTGAGLSGELVTTVHNEFLKRKPVIEQSNVCPRPVVVVVDEHPPQGSRGVPIAVFESKGAMTNASSSSSAAAAANSSSSSSSSTPAGQDGAAASAASSSLLHRVEFTFDSEEMERISVQQSADSTGTGRGVSWVGPAADRFSGAVSSLNRRMEVIVEYLKSVKDGKLEPDAELLRRIKQCATKLPRPEDAFELRSLLGEGVQDAVTTSTVSLMTKGTLGFAQLLEDTNAGQEAEQRLFK